jgi:hypothetical protein
MFDVAGRSSPECRLHRQSGVDPNAITPRDDNALHERLPALAEAMITQDRDDCRDESSSKTSRLQSEIDDDFFELLKNGIVFRRQ